MQSERVSNISRNSPTSVKAIEQARPGAINPEKCEEATSNRVKPRTAHPNRRLRTWLLIAILIVLSLALTPFVIVELIKVTNKAKIYSSVQAIPARPVAIVFGAGLNRDGSPSWMLSDRLDAAISLFKAGKVEKLLLTGDEVTSREISAMQAYAVRYGVPSTGILTDHAGLRTYDSCYRAIHNFGINSAVLVTQGYHLPRALFLCNGLGIDVVGLKAGQDDYPNQNYYNQREFLATFLSWVDITITQPSPEIQN